MSFGFGFGFPKADTAAAGGVPGGGASLRLNFLDSTTLDPRVTFSRTSNATVFDNTGKLIYAPHNLLPNSESFDNSGWTKSNSTVSANVAVAPDGTTTADFFVANGADSYVGRNISVTGGLTYVGSVYLRSDTPVSLRLYMVETAGGSAVQFVTCNVTTSWQRFSVLITAGTAVTAMSLQVGGGSTFTTGETVYAWGAQLNVANAPGDNLLTFSEQFDNAAWTKTNSSIQSNLLTFSEQFDNAVWTKTRSFIQTNQIRNNTMQGAVAGSPGTAPTNWATVGTASGVVINVVGTGTENGIAYIDLQWVGTATATSQTSVQFDGATNMVAAPATTYTGSLYVRRVAGSNAGVNFINNTLIARNSGGANIGGNGVDFTSSIGAANIAANRQTNTFTTPALTAFIQHDVRVDFTNGAVINITLRIGWPQLVQGAVAGDPVPTYGAARAVMYSAPGGSITADKLSEDTQTGVHAAAQGVTVSAGALVTASVYIKAAERTQWLVILDDGTGINFAQIDHAGSVSSGGSASGVTGSVTAVGDGWSRFSVTCAPTASYTTARLRIAPLLSGSISYTGDGTSGIYIWGSQLVQGTVPYDYVRTDATPVAIGYSAPDATMTADLLTATASPFARVIQNVALSVGTYTLSIYAKADTALFLGGTLEIAGQILRMYGNLTTGATTQTTDAGTISATSSSENVGGGWWRFRWTISVPTSATYTLYFAATDSSGSFTVTVGRSILIWGAQLNLGATALPYVETTNNIYPVPSYNDTTVQNLLGFTQEFDNATWTKAASYIQTNLLSYSEQLDNAAWAKANSVIQTNQVRNNTMQGAVAGTPGTAPTNWAATAATELTRQVVGVGVENGVTYIDLRYTGTVTATRLQYIFFEPSNAIPAVNGQQWCGSAWLKLVAGSLNNITSVNIQSDTRDAAIVYVNTPYISAVPLDSTFTRYSATGFATGATVAWIQPFIYFATAASGAIDITLRIGWPQLVLGNAAGEPVATAGTALPVQYTAPDASVTAELMIGNPGITTKYVFNQFSTTTTGPYTASVYAKAGTDNFVIVRVTDNTGGNAARQRFNLATGAKDGAVGIEGTVTNGLSEITPVGNGWYRCSVTGTFNSALTLIQANFWLNTYGTVGLTTSIFLWGAQLVQGAVPGDYQETVATALPVQYVAPDGSVTAEKLVETTANAQHVVFRSSTIVANTPHAASGYFKAGERTRINFRLLNGSFNSGANITFDLSNGTAPFSGVVGTGSNLSFSITPVGNGWYRCFASCVVDATSTSAVWAAYLVISGNNDSYLGDGSSGVYVWGAQLSDSASLDPYVYNPVAAPSAAAYYGPRFDYDPSTLAARGLLIEEQRTNSIRNSVGVGASAPSTLPTNWLSNTTGLTLGVVGTGTENGIAYIDVRFSGTPTQTFANVRFDGNTQIAASNGQAWTSSFYARMVAGSTTNIGAVENRIQYRDIGGASVTEDALNFTSTVSAASLSVARRTYTLTATSASTAFINNGVGLLTTIGQPIDITLRIGLPQLELGAFATSVIPTTTAAATRTADVATMVGANFSNWCNQNEGTLFADLSNFTRIAASFPRLVSLVGTDANADEISIYTRGLGVNAGQAFGSITVAGVNTFDPGIVSSAVDTWKAAIAYRTNDAAFGVSGQVSATDTAVTLPVTVAMRICGAVRFQPMPSAWVRQITYFPRRLANSELQTVTL